MNWYYFLFLLLALVGLGAVLIQGVTLNRFVELRFTTIQQELQGLQIKLTQQDIKTETSATGPVSTTIYTDDASGLTFVVPTTMGPETYSVVSDETETSMRNVARTADGNIPACETSFTILPVPDVRVLVDDEQVFSDDISTVYANDGETCGITFLRLK